MPESACSLRVASVVANLLATHHTSMFHLLTTVNFSLKEEIFLVRTLHFLSCLLVSKVKCSFIYDTAPFFPGGFQKKTNLCTRVAVNLNVSHFKKSHCVQIAKRVIFFGEALVVMCTLN